MKNLSKFLALVLVMTLVISGSALAEEETTFMQLLDLSQLKSSAALEGWRVAVDTRPFEKHAAVLHVDLLDGQRHRIERTEVEERAPGDLAWRGRFADGGQVTLTLKNGFVVGLIDSPDGLYELTTSPEGQIFQKLDSAAFQPCANEDDAFGYTDFPRRGFRKGQQIPPVTEKSDSLYIIDIMTVYTPQARNGAGGTAAIQATAQSAIDVSNTAFNNSLAIARFNLVHTQQVDYNDTGNIQADRNWLRNNATVKSLRNIHAADLVGMLVENGGGFCGIAFLMGNQNPAAFAPNGYQVTARSCAVGNLTYAHEHGHNMGLQHDPANGAPPSQAIYPWSYGHYVNGHYRTVMSYSNQCTQGCPRHPYFSNPEVIFQGAPTGIANQRHNSRTINLIAPYTVHYRPIVCDLPQCID